MAPGAIGEVDMVSEVERIGEECRRYSEQMVARMEEAKAQREARNRAQAEQAAAEMRQLQQEMAEPVSPEGRQDNEQAPLARRQPEVESFRLRETEVQRLRDEELRRQQDAALSPVGGGGIPVQRGDGSGFPAQPVPVGELDTRESIARSAAARRRNNVVAPIDDDGDDEAEYYRRKSWLV